MAKKVRLSTWRGAKPVAWLFRRPPARFTELLLRRRVRPLLEELEDRSTPSATAMGLDVFDFPWLAQQQQLSLRSDVCQFRNLENPNTPILACPAVFETNLSLATAPRHEVILIDAAVPNLDDFVRQVEAGLPPGAWYDLYLVDSTHGGVEQISDILSQYHHDLDAVHLFSHGASGELLVGSDILDSKRLSELANQVAGWGDAFKDYGDLLLYGCDVSAGAAGQAFVEQLHQLTGLDVAASADGTGAALLGGDWVLETHLGDIGAASLSLADRGDAWSGLLNTYTVLNRNDSGIGSLRQAILDANANAGTDTINFAIVGAGTQTINLASQLPTITGTVTLDATTQLGFSGTPLVVLNGGNAVADGLRLGAGSDGSEIRGFVISRFTSDAIEIIGGSGNNLIAGNYLGTSSTGNATSGNGGWGIRLSNAGSNNQIGGTTAADRNVISDNSAGGILLDGGSRTTIRGNYIGLGADGTTALGNGGDGIVVQNGSDQNVIGGTAAGAGNVIAYNDDGIVVLLDPAKAIISGNSIHSNLGLGIDLDDDGVTLNDPNDGDGGGNVLKNFPTLTSALISGGTITITGSLNSVATGSYRIEFFANSSGDPSGYGQGQRYLGFVDVTTDGNGDVNFSPTLTATVSPGEWITATNTDLSRDVTSEFSANIMTPAAPLITSNGGGSSASVNVPENTTAVLTVAASDANGDSLSYSISGGADAARFAINPTTGVLTFLVAPNFESPTDVGANNVYNVTVQVSDGNGGTDTQAIAVTVTNVNETPVITAPAAQTTPFRTAIVFSSGNGNLISVNDDSGAASIRVTLTVADGRLTLSGVAGLAFSVGNGSSDPTMTFTGSLAAINAALAGMRYDPDNNFVGADALQIAVNDLGNTGSGGAQSASASITLNVVNGAPTAGNNSYSTAEDTPLVVSAAGVLGNDNDPDGNALTAVLVSGPTHGSLTFNADGSFTYTPNLDSNGPDSFTYRATDGSAQSNLATVTLTVTAVNDAPIAVDNSYSTNEDTPLVVNAASGVLSNDSDVDGPSLTAILVSGPTHGTLTLNANGSLTYTPSNGYSGPDSFTYRVSDGSLLSNVATVSLTINAVNDAPVAVADSYSTNEDTPLAVSAAAGVLANDSDVDSATLTAVLVAGPTHGSLTLNANGSFTYTPTGDYNGPDSFTYRVSDGSLLSNVVTVTLNVGAVNDAPLAVGDSYSVNEDGVLVVNAAGGVLANDSDVDNATLTAVLVAGPAHGSLTLNANGSFTYTPAGNYNGPDSFTYRVSDGSAFSNVVTVSLTVNAVNDAPVANANSYSTSEDTPLVVNAAAGVLANDTDVDGPALTAILVAGPTHGSLTLNANGSFIYTPAGDYNGPDSFTYRVSDGSLLSNVVTVSLTVNAVNDAPVAVDDAYSFNEDLPLTVPAAGPLANDLDVDSPTLTAILVTGPTHGSLTLNADGSFTYVPDADYNGPDSFTYRVSDGSLLSNVATVSLTVDAVNDAPVGVGDGYATNEDTPLTVSAAAGVLANDSDVDSAALTAVLVAGPTHGSLILNGDGSFTYTPDSDDNGPDSFTYRVSDGSLFSNVVTVSLAVNAVNDAPVAGGNAYVLDEDVPLTVAATNGVLANDSDVDGPALAAILVTGPTHGVLSLNADGSFTYTAAANYNGPDSFTYQVSDGSLLSNVVTVSLTVGAVNDAPVGADEAFATDEDTPLVVSAARGVLANDDDVDGPSLSAVLVTGPLHGSVTLQSDGSFVYRPDVNYNGADSFVYRATDGGLDSHDVTVSLTVAAVNDAPTLRDSRENSLRYSLAQGAGLPVGADAILDLASDVDGDPLSTELVSRPSHGTLVRRADGSFKFVPNADFVGADQFVVRVTDGQFNSEAIVVHLVVAASELVLMPPNSAENPFLGGSDFPGSNDGLAGANGSAGNRGNRGSGSLLFGIGGEDDGEKAQVVAAVNPVRIDFPGADKTPLQQESVVVRAEMSRSGDGRWSYLPSPAIVAPVVVRFQSELWQQQSAQLYQELDKVAENVEQGTLHRRQQIYVAGGVTVTLTSGYVLWQLRSLYLVLSALSARPLWRTFDPLAILDNWESEDDDEVEKMFD